MVDIRTARPEELSLILDWAAEEGWNPGLGDAKALYLVDPNGFFVSTDPDDIPIAAISVVNHSDTFAFLGLYIVRPDFRGKGIGFGLWNHALQHAGDRVVGLDGVEDQQANYAASGFKHAGGTTRYSGKVPSADAPNVRRAHPEDLPDLITLEAHASGTRKPCYLQSWFTNTEDRVTFVLERDGGIEGLCTVRKCRDGAKIGPLVAETRPQALALIAQAAAPFEGVIILDLPETSAPLIELADHLGLTPSFRTARMYRGEPAPEPGGLGYFAVTSLELG